MNTNDMLGSTLEKKGNVWLKEVADHAQSFEKQASEWIRKYPMVAIGGAIVIGFVTTKWISGKWKVE